MILNPNLIFYIHTRQISPPLMLFAIPPLPPQKRGGRPQRCEQVPEPCGHRAGHHVRGRGARPRAGPLHTGAGRDARPQPPAQPAAAAVRTDSALCERQRRGRRRRWRQHQHQQRQVVFAVLAPSPPLRRGQRLNTHTNTNRQISAAHDSRASMQHELINHTSPPQPHPPKTNSAEVDPKQTRITNTQTDTIKMTVQASVG